jgi:membrane protein
LKKAWQAFRSCWVAAVAVVSAVWAAGFGAESMSAFMKRAMRLVLASALGAAGSLVVMVIWVYYSAQIFYFGAEFTHVYACSKHAA